MKLIRFALLAAGLLSLSRIQGQALACAACFGQSDSPMAQGLNAGIFTLLGVVGSVLGAAAAFFVYLARKSPPAEQDSNKSTQ